MELIIGIGAIIIGLIVEICAVNSLQKSVAAFFLALMGCAMWMFGAMYIAYTYFGR